MLLVTDKYLPLSYRRVFTMLGVLYKGRQTVSAGSRYFSAG